MRAVLLPLALGLALSAGCRQQIVVYDCPDGGPHVGAGRDGGDPPDARLPSDAGLPTDAGVDADAGDPIDAGGCDPFCLTGVDVSADTIDVRELVTLTPRVDAAPGVQWTVQIEPDSLAAERPAGRPALRPQEVPTELVAMDTTALGFRVTDVPPWFMETTYAITVRVQEVGTAFARSEVVRVRVRGNIAFSTGTDGHIYTIASDGQPATGGGAYPDGLLVDMLVVEPRQMRMLDDGTLLVLDAGANPDRLLRFSLDGADVLQGELQFEDEASMPILRSGASTSYGLAQLASGQVVLPEYQFSGASGAPKSRLVVWGADGRYERELWAPTAAEQWQGVAQTPDGALVVAETDEDVLDQVDPTLWRYEGRFLDQLPGSPYTVEATTDALYVGGFGYVFQLPWAGGRAAVTGLDSASTAYRALTAYTGGRVLVATDRSSRVQNIALVEGRAFVRWLRAPDVGPVVSISGLAYLR